MKRSMEEASERAFRAYRHIYHLLSTQKSLRLEKVDIKCQEKLGHKRTSRSNHVCVCSSGLHR